MPDPIINGSGLATFNREQISFVPFEGRTYGGRYEGPSAAVKALIPTLEALGYAVDYECDASPAASLTFRSITGSPSNPTDPNAEFVDTWELIRNTVQKEILESDHPLVAVLTETHLIQLKRFMSDPKLWDEAVQTALLAGENNSAAAFSDYPSDSNTAANYLWDLFRSGARTLEVKQPILRLTRVTSALYSAVFDVSNTDKLMTTATMISDSGVPSTFAIPLVQLANVFIDRASYGNDGDVKRSDHLSTQFGWLKDIVSVNKTGRLKLQYVIEWKFGLYDTVLYRGAPS